MNTTAIVQQLNALKLNGMAKRHQTLLSLPTHQHEDAYTISPLLCHVKQEYQSEKLAQLPFEQFYIFLGEVSLPEAILDWMSTNADIINLEGYPLKKRKNVV